MTVRLRDVRVLRGQSSAVVRTVGPISCGYEFRVGARYLIFAGRDADGALVVSRCGLTRPLDEGRALARYVDSLAEPSRGGRIFGRVVLLRHAPQSGLEGVPDATVRLDAAKAYQQRTNAAGEFEFIDLPPGEYRVTVDMPANREDVVTDFAETVTFDEAHACASIDVHLERLNGVSGSVLDADGRPWSNVFLMLNPVGVPVGQGGGRGETTDEAGRYRFASVPPGRYRIEIVRLGSGLFIPSSERPGLPAAGGQEAIDVPAGEVVRMPVYRVPQRRF